MNITKEKAEIKRRTEPQKKLVTTPKKKVKSLADFYGKLPTFGNGAAYQKALRNE